MLAGQHLTFPYCGGAALIKVICEILEMNTLGGFLALFHANQRNFDFSGSNLPKELSNVQMTEIIAANLLNWNYRFAPVLSHKQKCSVHLNDIGHERSLK